MIYNNQKECAMTSFFTKLVATGMALSMGLASYGSADNNNGCCPPPACDPCASWCDNLSFNASLLYWRVTGDEYDYVAVKDGSSLSGASEYKQRVHDVAPSYDPGFRLGLGFVVPCWGWGFDVIWTHFDTKGSDTTNIGANGANTVSYSVPSLPDSSAVISGTDTAEFRGHVKFHYDTVDLEMGKWLCCGNSALMFRPHVGLRFADIKDKFSIEGTFNNAGGSLISGNEFEVSNTFKGVGVRAGLDTDLRLCEGLSFIGRGAGSIIWGSNNIHTEYEQNSSTAKLLGKTKENYKGSRFITDLSLGLRYKTVACCCYPVTLEVLWEHHYLVSQHRYFVDEFYGSATTSDVQWKKNGNVALQGWTFTAGFDF